MTLIAALCITVIDLGRVAVNAVDTGESSEAAVRARLEQLQKDQEEIKDKLDETKNGIADNETKRANLDALIVSTQTEIELSEELIAEYDEKIRVKKAEIADLEKSIDDRFDMMMERLRFSYEEGNATYLALIISSDSLSDFLSNSERVESMMDFDRSLMKELAEELQKLDDERAALENTLADQKALKASLEQKKADLEKQVDEANAMIEQLRADEKRYEEEEARIKAAEDEANEEIRRIIEERQRTINAPPAAGEYIWPVPGHTRISSPFGHRELYGKDDFHRGIDIPAPQGTPIYACNSGTVIKSTWHYSWGYYIVIDHGGGYSTLYAHCSRLLVSEGDTVERGDMIGKVGETGNAYGAHLHLEFWVNGKLKNPLDYINRS